MASPSRPIGIFTIDPGGHSGLTWGIYDLARPLVKEAMRTRKFSSSTTVEGNEDEQLQEYIIHWDAFTKKCDEWDVYRELVIEDFSLLPGSHTPGKEGISPVRHAWVFVGYLWGRDNPFAPTPIWQLPSIGMRYNERKMLESWGAWIKGRPHERAAFAHAGARLMRLYQNPSYKG